MFKIKSILFLFIVILFSGCAATPNMDHSVYGGDVSKPDPGKALVIFMRPSRLGFIINSAVYDDEKFIGMVPYQSQLAYMAEPGTHRFMVISEAADFMNAELVAGKTYYAIVTPRMGVWRARFSLAPVTSGQLTQPEFKQWLAEAKFIKNTESAYAWDKANHGSVLEKKTEYLAAWMQKPEAERPFLRKEDGR